MANKQTAVSWLVEQLAMQNGSFHAIAFYNDNQDIIQQAEAIGKEQMIEFAENYSVDDECISLGHSGQIVAWKTVEEYYKETYESNPKI